MIHLQILPDQTGRHMAILPTHHFAELGRVTTTQKRPLASKGIYVLPPCER